jgi:DNA-binding response OmpR family regulator
LRLLLIEGQKSLARSLSRALEDEGYQVDVARDAAEGDFKVSTSDYEIIVFDLAPSCAESLERLEGWRRSGLCTFVLILKGPTSAETVRCLDLGADDCLSKPFEMDELLARVRALARRAQQIKPTLIKVCDLEIDPGARSVRRGGLTIRLTPREYALLELLATYRGRVVSRSMIMERLYDDPESTSNVIDVYIGYLRTKIDKGFEVPLIITRRGQGYMLRGEEELLTQNAG